MDIFTISNLIEVQRQAEKSYHEFLRVPDMSAGLYRLAAGSADLQEPHTEDELYYVVQGRARIQVGNEDRPVETGSLIFVAANVDHRFYAITEDLTVLVFFAPSEYSRQ